MIPQAPSTRKYRVVMILTALVILVPSMWGFGNKFYEFLLLVKEKENEGVSFAIAPVMNYLLVSAGFFLLFFWAVWHGMFRDIEKPKYTMLEREAELDKGMEVK